VPAVQAAAKEAIAEWEVLEKIHDEIEERKM
jgi:hypothetical protein